MIRGKKRLLRLAMAAAMALMVPVSAAAAPEHTEQNPGYVNLDQEELGRLLFEGINRERVREGLPELAVNVELADNAGVRAIEINRSASHIRPGGGKFFTAVTVNYEHAGENNVFADLSYEVTAEEAAAEMLRWWMESGPHRENLMNGQWQESGVGIFVQGSRIYAVQLFIA